MTVADERTILHFGSSYGGNALLGKIAHGLRQVWVRVVKPHEFAILVDFLRPATLPRHTARSVVAGNRHWSLCAAR